MTAPSIDSPAAAAGSPSPRRLVLVTRACRSPPDGWQLHPNMAGDPEAGERAEAGPDVRQPAPPPRLPPQPFPR